MSVLLKNRFESEFQGRILDFDLFKIVNSVKDEVQWIHSIILIEIGRQPWFLMSKKSLLSQSGVRHYISWQGQVIRLESDRIGLPSSKSS